MTAGLPMAIAVGDPCGVGPLVSVRAALLRAERAPIVLFGDLQQLGQIAGQCARDARVVPVQDLAAVATGPNLLQVWDTGAVDTAVLSGFAPHPEAGAAQLRTLAAAASAARERRARALVTGPTSKAAVVSAGHAFIGQTEFLAGLDGRSHDDVTMLFLGPKLRVALVTTHLALAAVPEALTRERVMRSVRHLAQALLRLPGSAPLTIAVTGLNPHAGEEGLFGREEIDVIAPALQLLKHEEPFASGAVVVTGPSPAEAVFRSAKRGDVTGVVAMFHDQATIASKLLDWGAAVNTTWGLSFLRTSVDHGVAYDAAARGLAEHEGMLAALDLALQLTPGDVRDAHG